MTTDDVIDLLTLAAVYDQRTVGESDVKGWLLVAQAQRWEPSAAQRVIVEHHSSGAGRDRIDPATITDRLRTLRSCAAESFEAPRIPAGLPNREYPAWLRRQLAGHVDAELARWADTGAEPSGALAVAPAVVRTLPELVAAAPAHARPVLAAGVKRVRERRVRLDPGRRAAAQAELDAVRRATSGETGTG